MNSHFQLINGRVSLEGVGLLRYVGVKDALEYNGRLILLLTPEETARTVLAVDSKGQELWTIQEAPGSKEATPYTSIFIENGSLCAYNWDGFSYFIDPHTGKVARHQYLK